MAQNPDFNNLANKSAIQSFYLSNFQLHNRHGSFDYSNRKTYIKSMSNPTSHLQRKKFSLQNKLPTIQTIKKKEEEENPIIEIIKKKTDGSQSFPNNKSMQFYQTKKMLAEGLANSLGFSKPPQNSLKTDSKLFTRIKMGQYQKIGMNQTGNYFVSHFQNSKSQRFGDSKRFYQYKEPVPGPGTYYGDESVEINKYGKYSNSKYKCSGVRSFSKSQRPFQGRLNNMPGPGTYFVHPTYIST